jgi:hypothetical protein
VTSITLPSVVIQIDKRSDPEELQIFIEDAEFKNRVLLLQTGYNFSINDLCAILEALGHSVRIQEFSHD